MDDITFKGIGIWLLAILNAIVVFISFLLGKWTNGFPPEFAIFIGTLIVSTQILIILIIKRYFKLEDT